MTVAMAGPLSVTAIVAATDRDRRCQMTSGDRGERPYPRVTQGSQPGARHGTKTDVDRRGWHIRIRPAALAAVLALACSVPVACSAGRPSSPGPGLRGQKLEVAA